MQNITPLYMNYAQLVKRDMTISTALYAIDHIQDFNKTATPDLSDLRIHEGFNPNVQPLESVKRYPQLYRLQLAFNTIGFTVMGTVTVMSGLLITVMA